MVNTKKKYKSPIESGFPSVDVEQDQSLTIQEILYNVSHGLPTGLVPGYVEFDDDDDNDTPPNFVDDEFDMLDIAASVDDASESEPEVVESEPKAAESEPKADDVNSMDKSS